MRNDTANFAAAHSLDIECFYQNVRGLRSKTHDIFDSIVQSEYDIICLSTDCPYLLSLVDLHVPRLPVRSPTTFYLPFPRSNVLLFSPLYRICHDT